MKIKLPLLFLAATGAALAAETPAQAIAAPAACAQCQKAAAPADSPSDPSAKALATASAKDGQTFSKDSLYQLDGEFTDDSGRTFTLGELRSHPVVLSLFFASCGYACPLIVTDMLALQDRLPVELRSETRFVLVSFDVNRDTPAALAHYRAERHLDKQWTLLHGNADAVRELAALVGVKYKQEADGMFSHSNLLTVLNKQGEIVHQRIGLTGGLDETAAALVATGK
ncbi:MAG: SCO family protein [Opitutaceae bacterium]